VPGFLFGGRCTLPVEGFRRAVFGFLTGKSAVFQRSVLQAAGLEALRFFGAQYPGYPRLHGRFVPHVSTVDVLMACGDRAPHYLWGYREVAGAGVSPV
jgi:hypothetical protein